MRSLDFTACTKDCPIDCWRKLTKEEQEWLENNPNRMSYTSECVEQPRFRRCEDLGCHKRYNCKEKLDVQLSNHGYTMDYRCPYKNEFVYWE